MDITLYNKEHYQDIDPFWRLFDINAITYNTFNDNNLAISKVALNLAQTSRQDRNGRHANPSINVSQSPAYHSRSRADLPEKPRINASSSDLRDPQEPPNCNLAIKGSSEAYTLYPTYAPDRQLFFEDRYLVACMMMMIMMR